MTKSRAWKSWNLDCEPDDNERNSEKSCRKNLGDLLKKWQGKGEEGLREEDSK